MCFPLPGPSPPGKTTHGSAALTAVATLGMLQVLRIGDVGLATMPCEVLCEIGLDFKQRSPLQPAFLVSLTHGYMGYLPPPRQHALGGYETWRARSSYLEPNASEIITAAIMDLFKQLHPGTASE